MASCEGYPATIAEEGSRNVCLIQMGLRTAHRGGPTVFNLEPL
jgi:hypothetical protein